MITSIAIVTGFQSEIRDKVIGFGSHIQITNFDSNSSFESSPLNKNQEFYSFLKNTDGIKQIQVYATKAGIIKTDADIEGILLKGIGSDFDWSFFRNKIIDGNELNITDRNKNNGILISKQTAAKLKIKKYDDLLIYFIQEPPRVRKFTVQGIYETGLEEFDSRFAIVDIAHIQKLNNWSDNMVGGFEVLINDFNRLDELGEFIYSNIGYSLQSKTIKELYPQIFDWLSLQDINVQVILTLMLLVAIINMTTALLIMILERTNMIGILKALGAANWNIRKIFLYNSIYIIGLGLLLGNLFGISSCMIQKYFGVITLPQESYYVSVVPVNLQILHIALLNIIVLVICASVMILPSYLITKIQIIKAIRFD